MFCYYQLVLEHIHVFPTSSGLDLGCSEALAKFSSCRGDLSGAVAGADVRRLCPDRCISGDLERTAGALQIWQSLQHGSDWVCTAQTAFGPVAGTTWADQCTAGPAQGHLARVRPRARNQPGLRGQQRHRKDLQEAIEGFGLQGTLNVIYVCL